MLRKIINFGIILWISVIAAQVVSPFLVFRTTITNNVTSETDGESGWIISPNWHIADTWVIKLYAASSAPNYLIYMKAEDDDAEINEKNFERVDAKLRRWEIEMGRFWSRVRTFIFHVILVILGARS